MEFPENLRTLSCQSAYLAGFVHAKFDFDSDYVVDLLKKFEELCDKDPGWIHELTQLLICGDIESFSRIVEQVHSDILLLHKEQEDEKVARQLQEHEKEIEKVIRLDAMFSFG